jgi:heme/copper-type cytochrome/quinol oxidase subunit 3
MTAARPEVPLDTATAVERPMRPVLDVSELPSVVFGSRVVTWWGTAGFMMAEAATLAACLAAYYYVLRNYPTWPPARTQSPDLLLPVISLAVLVASLIPCYLFARAAKRLDLAATRRWVWVAVIMMLAATVLRFLEFRALNVRWDANAYASVTWAIVLAHFTLLLADTLETVVFGVILSREHVQEKIFPGLAEDAFYSYFMVAAWIPCFVTVYLVPRWA